ncbi:MAG: YbhN family protein [Rickettsiales endosymbiont of Dermacentor nuttalli]
MLCCKAICLLIILALIYMKVDISLMIKLLQQMQFIWIILAIIILFFSFVFSALRLGVYLSANQIFCAKYFNIALSFIGILYNNILPGGIGGDAYKIYKISKLYQVSKLTLLRIMLSDRANGLLALVLMTMVLIFCNNYIKSFVYSYIFGILFIMVTIAVYILVEIKILKEKLITSLSAFKYSIIVQFLCLMTAVCILKSFQFTHYNDLQMVNYLIIFMISSIVAVIPISLGGAGLRELTFVYGSQYLGLEVDLGVIFAFMYFCINLLLSTIGIIFMYNLGAINDEHVKETI